MPSTGLAMPFTMPVGDVGGRDDVLEVYWSANRVGRVSGKSAVELRRVEQETGTFCFMALDKKGTDRLLILARRQGNRDAAERLVQDIVNGR